MLLTGFESYSGRSMTWKPHLGMVFQQCANFPHMNVAQNVGYGLRRRGLSSDQVRSRVRELLPWSAWKASRRAG